MVSSCRGVYNGSFGAALRFAGQSMLNTAHALLDMASQPKGGMTMFAASALAKSRDMFCLPYRGMIMERAEHAQGGFVFRREGCQGTCGDGRTHCNVCARAKKKSGDVISQQQKSSMEPVHPRTRIDYIARDAAKAEAEIRRLRAENKRLERRQKVKAVHDMEMEEHGIKLKGKKLAQTVAGINIMSPTIEAKLEEAGDEEARELWMIHRESLNAQYENGGKKKGRAVPVNQILLDWAVAFLAKTSASVYKEVAKVMLLPDIRHVQRRTAKLVSRSSEKAMSMCIANMRTIRDRADKEGWSEHARTGCIGFDSANINPGMEHDYVSNTLSGGDESHRLSSLSQMFHVMAEKVKKANGEVPDEDDNETDDGGSGDGGSKSSDKPVRTFYCIYCLQCLLVNYISHYLNLYAYIYHTIIGQSLYP